MHAHASCVARDTAENYVSPLQPECYWRFHAAHGVMPGAIVLASVASADLDLAIALAERFATGLVCARVPAAYVTSASLGRHWFLAGLHRAGRLHVLFSRDGVLWLLIFVTATRTRCLLSSLAPPSLFGDGVM